MGRGIRINNQNLNDAVNSDESIGSSEIPMNIESMDAQKLEWNVGYFVDHMDHKIVNFDAPVQRGYVWNSKKDSLLIRSILRRIPISNFYFNKNGNIYEGLEGKQRGTAIYRYVKGLYALHASTPPIRINGELFNIAKYKFGQLPKTLQNRILSYAIDGHWFDNMSTDEKIEFFILTNSGKPVSAAEISRIRIKSRDIFLSMADHPAILVGISKSNREKCKDEDLLSQLWCLCFSDSKSLLQKDIGPILEKAEVTEEQKNEIICALDYLAKLYSVAGEQKQSISKMKKPTHILSLAYMGFLAHRKGLTQEEYVEKAMKLFSAEGRTVTTSKEYNESVSAGSSKPDKVRTRIAEIEKALE